MPAVWDRQRHRRSIGVPDHGRVPREDEVLLVLSCVAPALPARTPCRAQQLRTQSYGGLGRSSGHRFGRACVQSTQPLFEYEHVDEGAFRSALSGADRVVVAGEPTQEGLRPSDVHVDGSWPQPGPLQLRLQLTELLPELVQGERRLLLHLPPVMQETR